MADAGRFSFKARDGIWCEFSDRDRPFAYLLAAYYPRDKTWSGVTAHAFGESVVVSDVKVSALIKTIPRAEKAALLTLSIEATS